MKERGRDSKGGSESERVAQNQHFFTLLSIGHIS